METSVSPSLVTDRLEALPGLADIPRHELEWLVEHGELEARDPGVFIASGEVIEHLFIVLAGSVVVRVDRGVGPRRAMEWIEGDVTGLLPFSRLERVHNEVLVERRLETLRIHRNDFPEMIHRCPDFTAHTVHTMVDRARVFRTGDLQDEKTRSLGKLAAGLAHELNNPASAAMRSAKLLRAGVSSTERASRALCRAGLSEGTIAALEELGSAWWQPAAAGSGLDREPEIEEWLERRGMDPEHLAPLLETSITIQGLDELVDLVPEQALDAALDWVVASAEVRSMAFDIEEAAARTYELVAAVRRFTHMDRAAGLEAVDVGTSLSDTMRIVENAAAGKGVRLTLEAAEGLPPARGIGSDLNQVWVCLMDNAIDAVDRSGRIDLTAGVEAGRIVVRVIDDGPGIAPETLPRIFDPFFTTKPPGQGMGLGLETARQLLRRCDGDIAVESRPGRTEFRVGLPIDTGRDSPQFRPQSESRQA
jgi:signal transduction histidine kinase